MESLQVFLFISVITMLLAGAATKSTTGILLGLAVVYLAGGMNLMMLGGWYILGGLVILVLGIVCLFGAILINFNFSRSVLMRLEHDGTQTTASQTLLGKGAEQSMSVWKIPERQPMIMPPMIDRGGYDQSI